MYIRGECEISGWQDAALDDLETLLEGGNPEWLGPAWNAVSLSEDWDITRRPGEMIIRDTGEEPFCMGDLEIMLQLVMRHYGMGEGNFAKIESWGEPEDGDMTGDGMVAYVNRYGSLEINPQYHDAKALFGSGSVMEMLDGWKGMLDLMSIPAVRESRDPKANIYAIEKDGAVALGGKDSFHPDKNPKILDISLKGDPSQIVANAIQIFPDAKKFKIVDLPKKEAAEILETANDFGLAEKAKPGPR